MCLVFVVILLKMMISCVVFCGMVNDEPVTWRETKRWDQIDIFLFSSYNVMAGAQKSEILLVVFTCPIVLIVIYSF